MISHYIFCLNILQGNLSNQNLVRILSALGKAIGECEIAIHKASSTGNEYYIDAVTDDEVDVIEDLLGAAYVVCQTYITKIISDVIFLHRYHKRSNPSSELKTTGDFKYSILSFGSKVISGVGYTQVQVIDAFANYFKHRDEWPSDWHKLEERSTKTAEVIMAVGASSGCTGNLRRASKVLGNEGFKNTIVFYDIVNNWCKKLYEAYETELNKMGLI